MAELAIGRATARRRRGGAALDELVPAPAPDPEVWGPSLLDALAASAGAELAFVAPPRPLEHHHGPWAHGVELRALGAGALAPGVEGPLVVRLASDRREADREAAALAANRAAGLGVPEVLAVVDLPEPPSGHERPGGDGDVPPGGAADERPGGAVAPVARAALVTAPVEGTPLPELIGLHLTRSDELLAGFATHHAAVHAVPVGEDLERAVPELDLDAELARIDGDRFGAQLDWLERHRPSPGERVLAHGGYQPLCVSGPGPEAWDALGGPGRGLAVGNWCGVLRAEREADVAFTLVAFWVAPHFAKSRSERTAVKMIRNTLATTHKGAYASSADLDPDRLRFWQAFHAVRGMARLAGAYDAGPVAPGGPPSPFAVVDRGPLPAVVSGELDRLFRMQHRA